MIAKYPKSWLLNARYYWVSYDGFKPIKEMDAYEVEKYLIELDTGETVQYKEVDGDICFPCMVQLSIVAKEQQKGLGAE